jgi:anti-sigma factor RsiW
MDCKSCSEEMTAYLDGELERARFREVEGHLEGCLPCLEQLESLKQSSRLVEHHLQEVEPRPEIWNNLAARIVASQAESSSTGMLRLFIRHRWLTACAALAGAVVLAVGVWGLWNYQQSEQMLRQYMSSYVKERDLQEQAFQSAAADANPEFRTADVQHLEYTDNPFVEVSDEEFQNPFHSEAQ